MIVQTARTVLRPVDRVDVDDLVLLDADPEVMRYVSGGSATSRGVIEDWVLPRAQDELRTGNGGLWVIDDRRYQVFLGWMSLRTPRHSPHAELELTYRLRRDAWGRGLATEAARSILDLAFDVLVTERVFASTTWDNVRSRAVIEKLGMRRAMPGPSSADAEDAALIEYEMSRGQWQAGAVHVPAPAPGLTA